MLPGSDSATNSLISVLSIGSCRVRRPLRELAKEERIDLVNETGASWFTHSLKEATQYVRALRGDRSIPLIHRNLICENSVDLPDDLKNLQYLSADIAVVEISTLKSVALEDFYLNVQMVSSLAWRTDGVDAWSVLHGRQQKWPSELEKMESIKVGRYDFDSILEELVTLKELLAMPMVIVDHLPAEMDGKPLADRVELNGYLEKLQKN